MNKISLGVAVICSIFVGILVGKFIYAPQDVTAGTWFAVSINLFAVLMNLSNVFKYGIDAG